MIFSTPSFAIENHAHKVYAAPHIQSELYQDFYQLVNKSTLVKSQLPKHTQMVIRLKDFRGETQNQNYWNKTRYYGKYRLFTAKIQMELWKKGDLLWKRTALVQRKQSLVSPSFQPSTAPFEPLFKSSAGLRQKTPLKFKTFKTKLFQQGLNDLKEDYKKNSELIKTIHIKEE